MKYYEDKSDRKMELKLLSLSEDDKLIRECMEQASAFYGCLGKMGVTEILCDRKKAQELGADCQITGIFTGGELTAFACAFEYTGLKRNGRKWLNPGDKEWRQIETLGTNVVVIPLLVGKEKVGRLIELLREQYRDSHLLFRISGEQSEKFQEDLAVVSEKNLKSHRYDAAGENVWLFHFAPQIRMEDTYFEEEILLILPGQEVLLEMGIEEAEVTMVKLTGYEIVRSEKGSAFFRKPGAACEGVLLQCDYEQLLRYQRFINLTNYEEHFEQTDRGKALIYSEKYQSDSSLLWNDLLREMVKTRKAEWSIVPDSYIMYPVTYKEQDRLLECACYDNQEIGNYMHYMDIRLQCETGVPFGKDGIDLMERYKNRLERIPLGRLRVRITLEMILDILDHEDQPVGCDAEAEAVLSIDRLSHIGVLTNDTEIPRESNVPMIRLSHMLCGYPAATVKNFEKGFEYYDEKTLKRVRVRESELTEDEVYQLSRRYRDRLKPIYLDVPVSEEVKKAQDELNEKYGFSDNRPQELIFIATRKHKKDEEHIYESWKTQFEMESSNFSSRNKYPNNCRFICSSITNAENSLYMKELTEFWVSVLTLAINRIPASSLQAYRLYKLGMQASEEELERLLNKRLNRMESVYDFVQERMKMKAELSFEEDDILVPEQKIPVHFDGSSGKELYINTSKIGLSRDCPKDELFTWIMEITEKKRQINQFLKAPRRAIDKASQHLKGRAESFFGDEYKMDQFQVEDLEAEIERLETNVLENSTSGLVDEAKFKEQIETVDKKVKKDIVSHIRRSTAVQVGCCLLLVYLLGFVPYWISAAKLGGSQFGSAVVVALAALAVAAAGGIAALFILRHRVRMSMEEYNHVIHTMVNNVNASADEFGKYFTAVCTYMKAQSIRAGIKLKSESISSAQFILRAHKQALKSSIERDEEVAASYGIRRVAEVEKNITSFFHEEKLPKDNALYYYETDKSDVGIPLNEAGDLVRAPYKFVAKLKLEREDLYDEVKGEV